MRPRLKTAVTFTAGLLVGAVAASALGVVAIFKIQALRERAMAHESTFYLETPEPPATPAAPHI